ncbi:hypothetical protein JIN84_12785 [Luteolibacter yonseiensis]|uniref:Uncharacterized protein n=1 Tax=Luteolibacter yonseiensis TaxID=1144680 RepID=A0A934R407_9BACT|nr:hypothetical protein [Luteolibacter yonseiensis]MBK1816494.1 hypothetical protein [Luteolibacter yonseiensis]
MKKILLILAVLCSFAAAQVDIKVRVDPPVEKSLRTVKGKELADAYKLIALKVTNDRIAAVGVDVADKEIQAHITNSNPDGFLITREELLERLKKGDKFTVPRYNKNAPCVACKPEKPKRATDPDICQACKGKGIVYATQDIIYKW